MFVYAIDVRSQSNSNSEKRNRETSTSSVQLTIASLYRWSDAYESSLSSCLCVFARCYLFSSLCGLSLTASVRLRLMLFSRRVNDRLVLRSNWIFLVSNSIQEQHSSTIFRTFFRFTAALCMFAWEQSCDCLLKKTLSLNAAAVVSCVPFATILFFSFFSDFTVHSVWVRSSFS